MEVGEVFKNAYDEGLIMLAIASKEYEPLNADTYQFELLTLGEVMDKTMASIIKTIKFKFLVQ